jgi:hypothetical protein
LGDKVVVNYLYLVKGDKESSEAVRLLDEFKIKYKKIYVDEEGNGMYMWRDLGTTDIPSLQSSEGVYAGLGEIRRFVSK